MRVLQESRILRYFGPARREDLPDEAETPASAEAEQFPCGWQPVRSQRPGVDVCASRRGQGGPTIGGGREEPQAGLNAPRTADRLPHHAGVRTASIAIQVYREMGLDELTSSDQVDATRFFDHLPDIEIPESYGTIPADLCVIDTSRMAGSDGDSTVVIEGTSTDYSDDLAAFLSYGHE